MSQSAPVQVRTYKGKRQSDAAEAFQKDAIVMAAAGYVPVSQSWAEGRSGCVRMIALGFIGALVWKPAGTLSVTYQYRPDQTALAGEAPPPQPPQPSDWSQNPPKG